MVAQGYQPFLTICMKKTYYIANVQLDVTSQINLDEYDNEAKFLAPVCDPVNTIPVEVVLAPEISIPDGPALEEPGIKTWICEEKSGSAFAECRTLTESATHGLKEIRIYDLWDLYPSVIRSEYYGDHIRILIKEMTWKLYMHSFRIWSYIFLERILLQQNALILHSASIISQGKAILFTAPSETGKTTQTDIWHRNDSTVTDLNGDRTILLKTGQGWKACGIPISGTSDRCEQKIAETAGIAFVERAPVDTVKEMSPMEKLMVLYDQVTVYSACEGDAVRALELMEDLIAQVRMVRLQCTMKDSAYEVLKDALFGASEF